MPRCYHNVDNPSAPGVGAAGGATLLPNVDNLSAPGVGAAGGATLLPNVDNLSAPGVGAAGGATLLPQRRQSACSRGIRGRRCLVVNKLWWKSIKRGLMCHVVAHILQDTSSHIIFAVSRVPAVKQRISEFSQGTKRFIGAVTSYCWG